MKKHLMILALIMPLSIYAQRFQHNFYHTRFSDALIKIAKASKKYKVNFLYNELEDFTVTQQVRAKNTPEAILQIIGFYPIRMQIDSTNIYVESVDKSERKLIGKVVDEEGKPLEFANITLLDPADSTFITGGVSNMAGDFVIPCDKNRTLAKITYVGYKTIYRPTAIGHVGTIRMRRNALTLKGVNVKGNRIVYLADRQLIIPTAEAVKHSNNGYELLQKMEIPGLIVNPTNRNIKSLSNRSVQIRINDVKASTPDILALRPDEVIRVENIVNPGARYQEDDLGQVLNFVVRRRYSGYVTGVSLQQSPMEGFNNTNAYFKINYKRSEFSLDYSLNYRSYNERRLDQLSTYMFPDGTTRTRNYMGQNTDFMYNSHAVQLGYNLNNPDKYVLNVRFLLDALFCPRSGNNQLVQETGKPDSYLYNKIKTNSLTPSLDIYYSANLPKKQKIDVNVVGTNIGTNHQYFMQQYRYLGSARESMSHEAEKDYSYSTDGNKYSLIGEAIYTKEGKKINFSSGLYYDIGYANNQYTGANNLDALLHTSNFYVFSQIGGKWKKLYYQLGVGAKRVHAHQGDLGYSHWTIRPEGSLSLEIAKNLTANYSFKITPLTPSLAWLTTVRQQNNDLMSNIGNAELQPYTQYVNKVGMNWRSKYVEVYGRYSYLTIPDVIMDSYIPEQQADGSYTITTKPLNQKNYKAHSFLGQVLFHIVPEKLDLGTYTTYNHCHSVGLDYSHRFVHWNWGMETNLYLGKWSLSYQFSTQPYEFFGETKTGGERNSDLSINYKWKNFNFGVGCILVGYPKGYDYKGYTKSRYFKSSSNVYIKDNGNMVFFTLSYDLSHGRKYKTEERTLQNSDTESGVK